MAVTLATPIQFARQIVDTNSQSLTDPKAIAYATDTLFEIRRAFAEAGVDAGKVAEVVFSPTAGIGVYNYPDGTGTAPAFFAMKAVGINFNNQAQGNYLPAAKFDPSNPPQGYSVDYLRVNQSTQNPLWDDKGSFFEIIPTPQANMNLTNAVKIMYFIQPSPYVTVNDVLDYPESIDPYILAYGIAEKHLESLGKDDMAAAKRKKMLEKMSGIVPTLGKEGQGSMTPQSISLTGGEF